MINVNQITSQLARMPDQALQQYAQMHKNDPYTVSLALAESNRRKEMRTNAQGQQGMAPQLKVIDQNIAGMSSPLPEDVGIGALPAPNMQGMADGGIVAFAGGDLVQDYYLDSLGTPSYTVDEKSVLPQERVVGQPYNPSLRSFLFGSRYVEPTPTSNTPYSNEGRGVPAAPPTRQEAPPQPDLTRNMGAGPGSVRTPSAASPTAADYADQYKTLRGKLDDKDPYADRITARSQLAEKQGLARLAEFNEDSANQGDVYAKKDARLAKREEAITKQESTNTGLAFLNAGLAIMSTPGGLATAIGKGARVGTEQFAAGLDKINRAKDLLSDAQDRAEEIRLARQDMTTQQRRAIKSDIDKDVLAAKDLAIAGARSAGAESNKVALAALEQAGAFARTKMQTDATRAAAATTAAASAGRLDLAEQRLQLGALQTRQKEAMADLKAIPDLPSKAASRAVAQRKLNDINEELKALGGATIPAPSAAAAPGGTVLNFDAKGNLVK